MATKKVWLHYVTDKNGNTFIQLDTKQDKDYKFNMNARVLNIEHPIPLTDGTLSKSVTIKNNMIPIEVIDELIRWVALGYKVEV